MCFNRKVIGGLAAVAVGVLVFAPSAFGRVLPLLFVAACPLSMIFMMRGMSGGSSANSCTTGDTAAREDPRAVSRGADQKPEDEIARLRAEVDQLRAELRHEHQPTESPPF